MVLSSRLIKWQQECKMTLTWKTWEKQFPDSLTRHQQLFALLNAGTGKMINPNIELSRVIETKNKLMQKSDYTQEPEKMKTQEYPYCLEEKHQIGLGQITLVAT